MAYLEQKLCTCRNCQHQQYVSVVNGNTPPTDRSCAVCDSCGFKSIWYESNFSPELKTKLNKLARDMGDV